ncbi:RHS repeat-associated core domain-containing protein [Amycolatopsis thermoflava]
MDAADLSVTKRWQDPYGVLRGAAPASWPDKHGYLGRYQDTTGMVHLGARDYYPATRRFTAIDPVLDAAVPQQLNGYAYGLGNPMRCRGRRWRCPLPPQGARPRRTAVFQYFWYLNW